MEQGISFKNLKQSSVVVISASGYIPLALIALESEYL